jgi:hypothetical protein
MVIMVATMAESRPDQWARGARARVRTRSVATYRDTNTINGRSSRSAALATAEALRREEVG